MKKEDRVFVKSKSGEWLMPTHPGKARFLVKAGKAKVIQRTPFAIQLTYETTNYTQPVTVGIDDGGIYVGVAAVADDKVLYEEEVTVRTDIKDKLDTRRCLRIHRRNRKTRYRQARFLNRKKPKGWIPPSIKSKKDSIVRTLKKIPLPKPSLIRLEDVFFDFQAMENPEISGEQYQQGPLLYEKNYKTATKTRDRFQCRACGSKENLEVHHLVYRSNKGTDKLSNLMTLCSGCHKDHHMNGLKLPKQKNYFYMYASHVQQGKNYLQKELKTIAPLETTFGYITSYMRRKNNIEKSHVNDAVVIANPEAQPLGWHIKTRCVQSRKRSLHEANAKKGRKEKNVKQKRNAKNTYKLKGFTRWDRVKAFGIEGFISGFTGINGCRIINLDGKYITNPTKNFTQVQLTLVRKITYNQGRVCSLVKIL